MLMVPKLQYVLIIKMPLVSRFCFFFKMIVVVVSMVVGLEEIFLYFSIHFDSF